MISCGWIAQVEGNFSSKYNTKEDLMMLKMNI